MKSKIEIALLALPLLLQACATPTKSTLLGAVVGGTLGAVMGHQTGTEGAPVAGAAIGAGVGSLIGYLSYKDQSKKSDPAIEGLNNAFPELTEPKLRSIYVPDKIEGNRYIKGHQIYIIEDPGNWKK